MQLNSQLLYQKALFYVKRIYKFASYEIKWQF